MRLLLIATLLYVVGAQAEPLKKFDLKPGQIKAIQQHHQQLNKMFQPWAALPAPLRPDFRSRRCRLLVF